MNVPGWSTSHRALLTGNSGSVDGVRGAHVEPGSVGENMSSRREPEERFLGAKRPKGKGRASRVDILEDEKPLAELEGKSLPDKWAFHVDN